MIPELQPTSSVIRISPEIDVPITPRVRRLIDTAPFRRLAGVTQLGLVSLVYPGAIHSRFEHSLGVYRNAIDVLKQLANDPKQPTLFGDQDASLMVVSALLHDLGHWPFCHLIEDLGLLGSPRHELLAQRLLVQSELAGLLKSDWDLDPESIAEFLDPQQGSSLDPLHSILRSILSGPIDIDKLDYLERDSLHAGVPYGRNFDRHRLVSSMCIDAERNRIALSEKGRTAAEMMVFARYVMFSEVYWHHAVRSATAMLQRCVFELRNRAELVDSWLDMDDSSFKSSVLTHSLGTPSESCASGIFGPKRMLYKRIAQFDRFCEPQLHRSIASKPYPSLVELSGRLAHSLSIHIQSKVGIHDVLIDAPPVECEVQFDLRIRQKSGQYLELIEVSPVVQSLATRQFDAMVKRVRVFVHPKLRDSIRKANIPGLLREILDGSS
ncbi:MAG: HD domain-containing protein [Planctomycetota bacterium]|nr:HD domain-containing protein [Planctomycetota bacterium]